MTAAAWVDTSNWIRGCQSWKHPYLELMLIVFFCLIPSGTDEARHTTQPEHWFTGAQHMSSFPEAVWIQRKTRCSLCCGRGHQRVLLWELAAMLSLPQDLWAQAGIHWPHRIPWCPSPSTCRRVTRSAVPPSTSLCILWTGQSVHGEQCFVWWEKVLIVLLNFM